MNKTLKEKVDDLTSELKEVKKQAGGDAKIFREQTARQSSELIGSIEEAAEDMASDVRESIEELKEEIAEQRRELEKEREDKNAFAKSRRFYMEGISAFKEKNFSKALEHFIVACNAARGVISPVFQENGLSAAFNAKFLLAECLEKLNRNMEALDIYYRLYVNTTEDSDYHKLFVEKTLSSIFSTCAKGIWGSWSEERKEKIRQAANLSIEPETGVIPYYLPPDWRVVYILSLFDPEFKDFYERFNEINRMHNERKALLDENKQKITEVSAKIKALLWRKEESKKAKAAVEDMKAPNPKDFSGAKAGITVGIVTFLLTPALNMIAGFPFEGSFVIVWPVTCIVAGYLASLISRSGKYERALNEFRRQKQQKISEKVIAISQTELEVSQWRERKSQLEKWYEDNHILIVGFEK